MKTHFGFHDAGTIALPLFGFGQIHDIAIYLIFRTRLHRLSTLKNRWLVSLLVGSAFAYGVTQYLMNAILSHDIHTMRQASIVSFLVLLLFFLVFSLLLLTISARDQERAQRLVLQQTDRLMEKNYQTLHQDLQENAKRLHDFHHHLQAILGLAEQAGDQKTEEYVQSLLTVSYRDVRMCSCGNDIIDAVINCSAAEAARSHIDFHYNVELSSSLSQISPIDLCAVLGNQVENALDACKKIPDSQRRFIQVSIRQNKGFVVIQVINSAYRNPFTADGRLVTNKEDPEFHGLGLKEHPGYGRQVQWLPDQLLRRPPVPIGSSSLLFYNLIHKNQQFAQNC